MVSSDMIGSKALRKNWGICRPIQDAELLKVVRIGKIGKIGKGTVAMILMVMVMVMVMMMMVVMLMETPEREMSGLYRLSCSMAEESIVDAVSKGEQTRRLVQCRA